MLNRITGRRLCKSCGKLYNVNIDSVKPKIDNICDNCGSELYQRSDDNAETFEVRFQEYLDKTEPLIDYYKNKNILYEVDSTVSKEDTFSQIKEIING